MRLIAIVAAAVLLPVGLGHAQSVPDHQALYERSIQLRLQIDRTTDADERAALRAQKLVIDAEIEEIDRAAMLAANRALEAALQELTQIRQQEFAQAEWNCRHRSWRHGFRYPYSCSHLTFWR